MKAIVQTRYGSPDVLRLEEIDKPAITDSEVLVKVRAAAANPLDWHTVRGLPLVARPAMDAFKWGGVRGVDFAGTVAAVGGAVTRWTVGDEVYGVCRGSFAEYASANPNRIAPKPANLTFGEAASVPVAACTALQGLRDVGKLRAGSRVLITGAGGGIGSFAVQIAKAYGALVTGVCSTDKVDLVEELGADHVIDYLQKDFSANGARYDIVFDNAYYALSALRRAAGPAGIVIPNGGGSPAERWVGPIRRLAAAKVLRGPFRVFLADVNHEDLVVLQDLIEAEKVRPVISHTYPLSEAASAIRDVEAGHVRGKVVVEVAP